MTSRLLYVSPVRPAATGNGLAMRAGTVLRALATRHRVSLLVVPRYSSPAGLSAEIAACCQEIMVAPPAAWRVDDVRLRWPDWLGRRRVGRAATARPAFRDEPFDVVHVFRLAALPYAGPWLAADPPPRRWLDLDEVESASRRRLAALWRARGRPDRADAEEAAATAAASDEAAALAAFDVVFVSSDRERALLNGHSHAEIRLMPNVLPIPEPPPAPPGAGPPRLLFVGALGYPPNDAAAIALCRDIVPALRRRAGPAATATIAGGGASAELTRAAADADVTLTGYVADLASLYRDAQVVVVPIQAGGGTRIKAIEAFARRRPVVSTPLGVEGLDVVDGVHVLLGDDADAIARQCWRVVSEPGLGSRLVELAWERFLSAYSTDRLAEIVAALDLEAD